METSTFSVQGTDWTVELGHGSDRERAAAAQLRRILDRHDVAKWTFTTTVKIQDGVIPHSHPILTLNTRHLDQDELALASLLHEQMHWFLETRAEEVMRAIEELRVSYSHVPSSPPEGARDEFSTYLHLIVNALEYIALKEVLGQEQADTIMRMQAQRIYRWIYRTVVDDFSKIHKVLEKHKLLA